MNKPRYHILLIALVGLLAHSNTFNASFHFDDFSNIVDNPIIKDISYFTELSKANGFNFYNTPKSRFIGYFTFALNYKLHGLNVVGYHVVNLAIHIINAIFVYWLVVLTFRTPYFSRIAQAHHPHDNPPSPPFDKSSSRPPLIKGDAGGFWGQGGIIVALFSALLFVSHPIQTQAVTYIIQRFASLATMFYLLSLILYVKWRFSSLRTSFTPLEAPHSNGASSAFRNQRLKSILLYLSSVLSAVLAMKTKEIAFTLPIIIILYEFMFLEGNIKKRILSLIPLLLTMLIIPLTLIGIDKPLGETIGDVSEAARLGTPMSRWDYIFTQFRVIVTYIRLLFLPINQNLDYDYPVYHSFVNVEVILSFLLLLTLFGIGIYLAYRSNRAVLDPALEVSELRTPFTPLEAPRSNGASSELRTSHTSPISRLTSFGIFWFFITLSIESSIIPIIDVMFEHRLYLPFAGFSIAITSSAFIAGIKLRAIWPRAGEVIISVFIVSVAILSGVTYTRNVVWQDEIRLWKDVVKKSPKKARGHRVLGDAYRDAGRIDKAIEHYQIALTLKPDYGEAESNLGNAYLSLGQFDKAIEHFLIALTLKPSNSNPFYYYVGVNNNLGIAYSSKGLFNKAREYFWIALKTNPNYFQTYYNLGNTYLAEGLLDTAEGYFQTAIQLKPDYTEAHFKLGLIFFKCGLNDKARKEFETVLQMTPHDDEARRLLDHIDR